MWNAGRMDSTKTEQLQGLLGALPPLVASRLAKAIEIDRLSEGRSLPHELILDGLRPVLRRGKYVGSLHKSDNSALLSHIAQLDRSLGAERKALRREARSQAHKNSDLRQPRGR